MVGFFKNIAKDYRKSMAIGFVKGCIVASMEADEPMVHLQQALDVITELERLNREEE